MAHRHRTYAGTERLSPDCPKLTAVPDHSADFYPPPEVHGADDKPRIWSIAHTAVSLDPGLLPEYPPCMLSSTDSSSPGFPSSMELTRTERQQESPVATLREWMDGVFHGPPFQQPRPAGAWKDSDQTPGQPLELAGLASSL